MVLAEGNMPLPAYATSQSMPAEAESGWWHIFGFLNVDHLREEIALASREATQNLTSDTQRRLNALVAALRNVQHGEPDGIGSMNV
jgi:hypothetical protein